MTAADDAYDLVVIGGGIVGIAHAVAALERGMRVAMIERDGVCRAASVRNFGMLWPIGQRPGADEARALRSLDAWSKLAPLAGFHLNPCGSLHLVHHDDEARVVQEYLEQTGAAPGRQWLEPGEVLAKSPGAAEAGLLGALWSPTEHCVDPREAILRLSEWLDEHPCVTRRTGAATRVEAGEVHLADGARLRASHVIVCPGADQTALFPELLASAPLVACKLQMMRTPPQPGGWSLGPMLATGLTLRHYDAFRSCPSLPVVCARYAADAPHFDRYGIHVMASQNARGEVVLGDSHEYGRPFAPGSSHDIDEHILDVVRQRFRLQDASIAARWSGVYLKREDGRTGIALRAADGVQVVTGMGGAGMTCAFGFAEHVLSEL